MGLCSRCSTLKLADTGTVSDFQLAPTFGELEASASGNRCPLCSIIAYEFSCIAFEITGSHEHRHDLTYMRSLPVVVTIQNNNPPSLQISSGKDKINLSGCQIPSRTEHCRSQAIQLTLLQILMKNTPANILIPQI